MIRITRTIGWASLICLIGMATAAAAEPQHAPGCKVDDRVMLFHFRTTD